MIIKKQIRMKKYDIINADPPWRFSSRGARSGLFGLLGYKTMSDKEIMALNVPSISKDTSALFLWTPGAKLDVAMDVIKAWGYKYIRMDSVWEKRTKKGGKHKVTGPWGMNEAEYLLLGTKGKICSKQIGKKNLETIVSEVYPGKHSEKPQIFRDRIKYRFGDNMDYLEMFSRKEVEGWDAMGDAIDNLDIRETLK